MIKRKKANIILEFIVVIPVFFFVAWSVMQIIFYTTSQNVMQQATMDTARILSMELRGQEGVIPEDAAFKQKVITRLENVTKFNGLILLFHDGKNMISNPENLIVWENESLCNTALKTRDRTICVYTKNKDNVGGTRIGIEQIVVKTRAKFRVLGNFIPGLQGKLNVNGYGVAQKEIAGRFQYYQ